MIRILKNLLLLMGGFFAGRKSAPGRPPPVRRPGWGRFFKRLAAVVPALVLGGFLVAASGLVPIAASSGHWGITAWFLQFSKARSVATHTLGMSAPPLDDRALIVKGAGHYEIGCRSCHGGLEVQPRIPSAATPRPPYLPPRISRWEPEELFYIVKHGIKFTGMPAWPSLEREDEVWAVVAFLRVLPDLDQASYRRLVEGDLQSTAQPAQQGAVPETDTAGVGIEELAIVDRQATVPEIVSRTCAPCHGRAGEGREVSAFPRLAGQRPDYLHASLRVYASGERHSGIMEPVAAELTDEEMREMALYFARSQASPRLRDDIPPDTSSLLGLVPAGPFTESDSASLAMLEVGREIAYRGVPERKVPSCADCHGPVDRPRNPLYPNLAGQYADYLALQLGLFKDRRRGGSDFAEIMHHTVSELTAYEMEAVAQFYEYLGAR